MLRTAGLREGRARLVIAVATLAATYPLLVQSTKSWFRRRHNLV